MTNNKLVPPPHLSPSSIATFQQCPLKFKLSRIDGIKEPPTEATLRGNFVHSILETLYDCDASMRTLQTARQIAKDLWDSEYCERALELTRSENALRTFRWTSWWCVENVFKMENPQEIEFDGIETELNDTIGGVTIKGFIDRWHRTEDGIIIGDYKTGKAPQPRFQADKFFQLLLYGYVLEQQLGEKVAGIELLFIKDSVKLEHKATPEDMKNVEEVVVNIKKEIDDCCETGVFVTQKSRLCDWCFFKPQCPAWSKLK